MGLCRKKIYRNARNSRRSRSLIRLGRAWLQQEHIYRHLNRQCGYVEAAAVEEAVVEVEKTFGMVAEEQGEAHQRRIAQSRKGCCLCLADRLVVGHLRATHLA